MITIIVFKSGIIEMLKIELFTMPDYNHRIANWIYCNGSAIAYQATDQLQTYHNTVLL